MNTVSWLYHGCCALQGWQESSRRRRLLGCLLVTAFSTGLVQNLRPCTFVRTVLLYVRYLYRVRCTFHPWYTVCEATWAQGKRWVFEGHTSCDHVTAPKGCTQVLSFMGKFPPHPQLRSYSSWPEEAILLYLSKS